MPSFQDHQHHAERMIAAALRAADPAAAVRRHWLAELRPGGRFADAPTLVVAMGKSSLEMARACLESLARPAEQTVVAAVPERIALTPLPGGAAGSVSVLPADHPMPTERSVAAARAITGAIGAFARAHGSDGLVIGLLSGGASSQTCLPAAGLTIDDVRQVSRALQDAGASIDELNCVRKHIEDSKGGRLAAVAAPAHVLVLIASDVMSSAIDVVGSGPFAADPTTYADARRVLEKYGVGSRVPRVTDHLAAGERGERPESLKAQDRRVDHRVISSNAEARVAAAGEARALGFDRVDQREMAVPTIASGQGAELAAWACSAVNGGRACALVLGGEPTVDTRGAASGGGIGGPSQELALAAACHLGRRREAASRVAIAAFSTDGIDGPTDAAGAVVTSATSASFGIDECAAALARHDAWTVLGRTGALIRTGPTGVNVNHLAIALVYGRGAGA